VLATTDLVRAEALAVRAPAATKPNQAMALSISRSITAAMVAMSHNAVAIHMKSLQRCVPVPLALPIFSHPCVPGCHEANLGREAALRKKERAPLPTQEGGPGPITPRPSFLPLFTQRRGETV
jgi:hypothetical protein